jgi:hypothetical protein
MLLVHGGSWMEQVHNKNIKRIKRGINLFSNAIWFMIGGFSKQ